MASSTTLYTLPNRDAYRGSRSNRGAQGGEVIPFMTTRMIADSWAKGSTSSSRNSSSKGQGQRSAGSRRVQSSGQFSSRQAQRGAGAGRSANATRSTSTARGAGAAAHTQSRSMKGAGAQSHRVSAHGGKSANYAKATQSAKSAKAKKYNTGRGFRGFLVGFSSHLFIKLMIPVACLALAVGILYPVAKDYYISNYNVQKLRGEYDALSERNSTMEDQITWLKSDDGLAYCARELYGMVAEGETVLNVTGYTGTSEMTVLPEAVTAGAYEPEVGFLGSIAQRIFGVK